VTGARFRGTSTSGGPGAADYHPRMSPADAPSLPDDAADAARPPLLTARVLLVSLAVWSAIATMQALAQYVDQTNGLRGHPMPFLLHLRFHLLMYLPWMPASALLYGGLLRARRPPAQAKVAAAWLAGWSLLFMPPYTLYNSALGLFDRGVPLAEIPTRMLRYPIAAMTYDYLFFAGTFAFVYALAVFQRTLQAERRRQRIEAENLALRLEVEERRLAALRAQLEPHFLFNSLNALSALVRGGEQLQALHAVQRLSELLRYAIAASGKDWTSLGEEVGFVEDYLALQRLRFGSRLGFVFEAGDGAWREVECPPLLLQPLVENALRHDLEAGSEASEIRLACARHGDRVAIRISNPLRAEAPANGGTGIGLRNVTGRLALVYGERATIHARREDGRFVVELDLPADVDAVPA
jgi:two-component system sensor histidine kinase AlgZ